MLPMPKLAMSGLKPPTDGVTVQKTQTSACRINRLLDLDVSRARDNPINMAGFVSFSRMQDIQLIQDNYDGLSQAAQLHWIFRRRIALKSHHGDES